MEILYILLLLCLLRAILVYKNRKDKYKKELELNKAFRTKVKTKVPIRNLSQENTEIGKSILPNALVYIGRVRELSVAVKEVGNVVECHGQFYCYDGKNWVIISSYER